MSELIFLRVFGDLCVLFAVLSGFPKFFLRDLVLLIPGLLCAAGGAMAPWLEKHRLKYGALLLPLASLLLADTAMEYLMLVPALIYTALLIHRGAYAMEYYDTRDQFRKVGTALAVFLGVLFPLGYFDGMFSTMWDNYDFPTAMFYAMVYGFTQVFLLRQLRLGVDSRPQDRLRNNLEMGLVLTLIIGFSGFIMAIEELLRQSISDIVTFVMMVVGFVPMVILEIINWFLHDDDGNAYMETMASLRETFPTGEATIPDLEGEVPPLPTEEGFPWALALVLLAGLCLVGAWLLRNLSKDTGSMASRGSLEDLEPEKAKLRNSWVSNRAKVRRIYRNYLKFVKRKGLQLRKDHTSLDILREAKGPQDPAVELRRIYVRARYDLAEPVTDLDVEEAREALKKIQTTLV